MELGQTLVHYRFILVILFLGMAAHLLTPKGRLPLPLRSLARLVGSQGASEKSAPPSPARRLLAFVLIILAFIVCVI